MKYQPLMEALHQEFPDDLADRVNVEQMFALIDSILPVETCLHHQVLPLCLEGSRLHLGMVFTGDTAARAYARQIAAYLNYSLVTRTIPSSVVQTALSAYLKHTASSRSEPQASVGTPENSAPHAERHSSETPTSASADAVTALSTAIALPSEAATDTPSRAPSHGDRPKPRRALPPPDPRSERETYVVDSPTRLGRDHLSPEIQVSRASLRGGTLRLDDTVKRPLPQPRSATPPPLALDIRHPELPFERLADLPPRYLLPELLGRALVGNISRLYFESQPDRGRILLSDNGVLRSAIESVSKQQLQGVVNELKQMVQLPLVPIKESSRAELEYTYGGSTVLLRIRITTSQHGENGMLQVLQGAALKFYQRQQIIRVGHSTIDAAKQVQLSVNELMSRIDALHDEFGAADDILTDLSQILQGIDAQVQRFQQHEFPDVDVAD